MQAYDKRFIESKLNLIKKTDINYKKRGFIIITAIALLILLLI
jgi:hypothetical protein